MKRNKLWYFPLEPYVERYTSQLSRAGNGWIERVLNKHGIDYERVEGISLTDKITTGSVLDACGRGYWSMNQVARFLQYMQERKVIKGDVLYFDDFWTPGIETIKYASHLMNLPLSFYAMVHAQSVDIFDFTYPMRSWIRPLEIGYGKIFDGLFVTSTELRHLLEDAGIAQNKIHTCGLPYQSEEVKEHFTGCITGKRRSVVYTSRWDKEKCPDFFLDVIDYIYENYWNPPRFIATTSSFDFRMTTQIHRRALKLVGQNKLILLKELSKQQYYNILLEAKIQFNCADQDWVSWTLLEATTCGCRPVYPFFRSFPECLPQECLYTKGNVESAAEMIMRHINEEPKKWNHIYEPFDHSFERYLNVMLDRNIAVSNLYR